MPSSSNITTTPYSLPLPTLSLSEKVSLFLKEGASSSGV